MVTFRVIYQVDGTDNTEHFDFMFMDATKKERYTWIRAMREALKFKEDNDITLLALVRIS